MKVYRVVIEPYMGETHYLLAENGRIAAQKIETWIKKENAMLKAEFGENPWTGIQKLELIAEIDLE